MTERKKKLITLSVVMGIVVMVAAGSTIAYFTDTKDATNTFEMGDVEIKLDETDIDNPDSRTEEGNNYSDLAPGQVVTKDPIIYNTGSKDAYVRAKVTVKDWVSECAKYFPDASAYGEADYKNTLSLLIGSDDNATGLESGWSIEGAKKNDAGDVTFTLKYDGTLASGKQTTIFQQVQIPERMENDESFGDIVITGQAIQTQGFDSWEEAFAAFDEADD